MEQPIVRGVTASFSDVLITVAGGAGPPPAAAHILRLAAGLGVPVAAVASCGGSRAVAFTVPRSHGPLAAATLARALAGAGQVRLDDQVVEVALLGAGLRSAPAMTATFCEALARAGVRLAATSFESRRLAVLCPRSQLARAVRALCEVFEIGVIGVIGAGAPQAPPAAPADRLGPQPSWYLPTGG
ncbi:ACT domain-containing protein [Kitasatospora sp. NPDC049258]|uniref:ACT domain-containing protein n=1 Tax=Kitasatospora sp. NPDC049258 TaxID=3155394 RepID=UPI00343F8DE9